MILKNNLTVAMTDAEFTAYKVGSETLQANTIIRVGSTTYFADGLPGGVSESLSGGTVGVVGMFAGAAAPAGYRLCDGSSISREDYVELFGVIGEAYGAGDGSTTFNLPNFSGKVPVGLDGIDPDFNTIGNVGGEKDHQLTISEMPLHSHSYDKSGSESVQNSSNLGADETAGSDYTTTPNTGGTGGDAPHNNLQPYAVVNFIIKY